MSLPSPSFHHRVALHQQHPHNGHHSVSDLQAAIPNTATAMVSKQPGALQTLDAIVPVSLMVFTTSFLPLSPYCA